MNAVITAGDFLIAKQVSNSTSSFVCIIREVVLPSELRVLWWLTREELEAQRNIRLPPPPSISEYNNLLKCKVKEVFEDCSSTDKISVYDVCDMAFVFHPDLLEKKYVNCAGMSRVFFLPLSSSK
jgi:hypothetical protein